MTRTVAREIAVQLAFGICQSDEAPEEMLDAFFDREYYDTLAAEDELFEQYPDDKQLKYIRSIVIGTVQHRAEFDVLIEKYSKGWKLTRISRIALTILRTALFEVLYLEEVPERVAINEAVELAKGYEEPETVSFINGILGSFMRDKENASAEEV